MIHLKKPWAYNRTTNITAERDVYLRRGDSGPLFTERRTEYIHTLILDLLIAELGLTWGTERKELINAE